MKLSIIIVNYNVRYFLEQCLDSVRRGIEEIEAEVIVVDNASKDGSQQVFESKNYDWITYIYSVDNLGFSGGNNLGIERATGEYILLLNPDTVVPEDCFQKCLAKMESDQTIGGLGVKMIDGNGQFLPESKRGLPTPKVAFHKISGLSSMFSSSKTFGEYHLSYLPELEENEVAVLSGAFMLMPKLVLDKIGLLDDTFFMYGEDIDLSYRITEAGYKNWYLPTTQIIHYKGESTHKDSLKYVLIFYDAMRIFYKKHLQKKTNPLTTLLVQLAIYLRAGIAAFSRFAKGALLPILEAMLILGILYFSRVVYGAATGVHWLDDLVKLAFPLYAVAWIISLWLAGAYDERISFKRFAFAVLAGTLGILVAYSLLPETARFSRAAILLGATLSLAIIPIFRSVLGWLSLTVLQFKSSDRARVAVVADESEIEALQEVIQRKYHHAELAAFIATTDDKVAEPHFTSFERLPKMLEQFKLTELIFSSGSLDYNSIIKSMQSMNGFGLEYKIAAPSARFVIGSHSINTRGQWYSAATYQPLSNRVNRRLKRAFDVVSALSLILISPVFIWFAGEPSKYLNRCWSVLLGNHTWIGYAPNDTQLDTFPNLSPAVYHLGHSKNLRKIDPFAAHELNAEYARRFSVFNDFNVLLSSLSTRDDDFVHL